MSWGGATIHVTLSEEDLRIMRIAEAQERARNKPRLRLHPKGWELRGKHCSAVGWTPEEAWRLYLELYDYTVLDGDVRPAHRCTDRVSRKTLRWDIPMPERKGLLYWLWRFPGRRVVRNPHWMG